MFAVEKIGHPLPLPYLAPYAHGPAILTGINVASGASGWYDLTATRFVSVSTSLTKSLLTAHGYINDNCTGIFTYTFPIIIIINVSVYAHRPAEVVFCGNLTLVNLEENGGRYMKESHKFQVRRVKNIKDFMVYVMK